MYVNGTKTHSAEDVLTWRYVAENGVIGKPIANISMTNSAKSGWIFKKYIGRE